jgi:hypothetical protein
MEGFCFTVPERGLSRSNKGDSDVDYGEGQSLCLQYFQSVPWLSEHSTNKPVSAYRSLQRTREFPLLILTFTPWLLSRPCAIFHAFPQIGSYALVVGHTVVLHCTAVCGGLVHHNHTAILYRPWMFAVHVYGMLTSLGLNTFSGGCDWVVMNWEGRGIPYDAAVNVTCDSMWP